MAPKDNGCRILHWWTYVPLYNAYVCRDCLAVCTVLEIHANKWSTPR